VGKPSLNAAQPYAKAEGSMFLLVPAYPGCPGTKAVKRLITPKENNAMWLNAMDRRNSEYGTDKPVDAFPVPFP